MPTALSSRGFGMALTLLAAVRATRSGKQIAPDTSAEPPRQK